MRLQDPTNLPQDPRVANAPMYVPVEIYRLPVSNAREHERKINPERVTIATNDRGHDIKFRGGVDVVPSCSLRQPLIYVGCQG